MRRRGGKPDQNNIAEGTGIYSGGFGCTVSHQHPAGHRADWCRVSDSLLHGGLTVVGKEAQAVTA